jgi:hypothetical protein
MRARFLTRSAFQRSSRLNQTLLINIFLVKTCIVQHSGEKIDEEIAHHCSDNVHHQRNRNEGTQNTHDCRKDNKTNIEIPEMVVLDLIVVKLDEPSTADLKSARKDSYSSK